MFNIDIKKQPIVIMANNRSGSGSLATLLSEHNSLECFYEPTYDEDAMIRFIKCINDDRKDFLVKFMPHDMKYCDLYEKILARDCYKIKLTRNNTVDQIKSFYIGTMTKKWHHYQDKKEFTIEKNTKALQYSIEIILRNNNFFNTTDIKFDTKLTYESIIELLPHDNSEISPKPINDLEIRDWVKAGLNVYMSKRNN